MTNQRILVLQTGGTIGQERNKSGVFHPSQRDYLPLIRGISLKRGQELKSTPKKIRLYENRSYVMEATHTLPRIDFDAIQTANIDSTNMETHQRADIAKLIYDNARSYDGFVVIHGTDSMADTGAALPLMLRNLDKPVVITGSQKSIYERGSDADCNVINAIETATMDIGEVVIAFGDKIVRGNRAVKVNEQGLNAFDSPRVAPVGEIGIDIMLKDHRYTRSDGDPILFTDFCDNVESYAPKSGSNTSAFRKGYVDNDDVEGIVFVGLGAGNINDKYNQDIKRAVQAGKPVLVVTNCLEGAADSGIYGVGSAPLEAGAKPAGDMTSESINQKLMYAIGRAKADSIDTNGVPEYVDRIIRRPYAGEINFSDERVNKNVA
tara:strand:- start:2731 stop:3864 length:1134 start_codon:yes stop_codon:yes gene_type:complete